MIQKRSEKAERKDYGKADTAAMAARYELHRKQAKKRESGVWEYRFKDGPNYIRICPPAPGDPDPFLELEIHYYELSREEYYRWVCPRSFDRRADCFACDTAVPRLRKLGEKDEGLSDVAARLSATRRALALVIDRDDEDRGVQPAFLPWKKVYLKILSYTQDAFYGDISDPQTGHDFVVERTGKGKMTDYDTRAAGKQTTLSLSLLKGLRPLREYAPVGDEEEMRAVLGPLLGLFPPASPEAEAKETARREGRDVPPRERAAPEDPAAEELEDLEEMEGRLAEKEDEEDERPVSAPPEKKAGPASAAPGKASRVTLSADKKALLDRIREKKRTPVRLGDDMGPDEADRPACFVQKWFSEDSDKCADCDLVVLCAEQ